MEWSPSVSANQRLAAWHHGLCNRDESVQYHGAVGRVPVGADVIKLSEGMARRFGLNGLFRNVVWQISLIACEHWPPCLRTERKTKSLRLRLGA